MLPVFFAIAAPWIFVLLSGMVGALGGSIALVGPAALIAAVATLVLANRVVGALNPLGATRFVAWWTVPAGLLMGLGTTIIASEVENIGLTFSDVLVDPEQARSTLVEKGLVPAMLAITTLWGGLTAVVLGATQRVLLLFLPATATVVLTALAMALIQPSLEGLRYAMIVAPSAWIYARTRSLPAAMAAWLPAAAVIFALQFGYGPGIEGFDVTDKQRVLWQPVWFDVLGGALFIAGAFAFLQRPPVAGPMASDAP